MEYNVIEPDWQAVLIQWLLLFAIIAMCLIPAFLFRKLAKKYNRKGWLYFIVGLAVPLTSLYLTGLILRSVRTYVGIGPGNPYLLVIFFAMIFLAVFCVFTLLKNSFAGPRKQDTLLD